jgi:hypothetical protein
MPGQRRNENYGLAERDVDYLAVLERIYPN